MPPGERRAAGGGTPSWAVHSLPGSKRRGASRAELNEAAHDERWHQRRRAGVTEKERFEAELEFVQALANPEYPPFGAEPLPDTRTSSLPQYPQYWREPRYCKCCSFRTARACRAPRQRGVPHAPKADFKDMVLTQEHGH